MMDCEYIETPTGWACAFCQLPVKRPTIVRNCRGPQPTQENGATSVAPSGRRAPGQRSSIPSLGKRLANFSLAAISHLAKGLPTCTQAEIDARVAVCRACPLYRPDADNPEVGICTHGECGCSITREVKFLSKVAWRDQDCPLGNWRRL